MPRISYRYPDHLRADAEALPAAPGVYLFLGEDESLPLYIGKSVNLRARVLSHLRNRSEARMLRAARRISFQRTVGEIGALLLEARLVKERYPLLNRQLRRKGRLCSLRLSNSAPEVVYAQDIDFAREPQLFGLFNSRVAALQRLQELADAHKLCLGALGLEKLPKGRACFRALLGRCGGVCRGDETAEAHQQRLLEALQDHALTCWPWEGGIGVVERDAEAQQIHVVHNWCYLGSAETPEAARALYSVSASFDADSYKILCKPILGGTAEILRL